MAKIMLNGVDFSAPSTTYPVATPSIDGLMTAVDKQKLDGIASNAEVNVQADWSVTNSSSDAFIKNKPIIPTMVKSVTDVTVSGNKLVTKYSDGTSVTQFISASGEDVIDITGGTYTGFTNSEGVVIASIPVEELLYPARYTLFNAEYPGEPWLSDNTATDVITFLTTNNKQYTMKMTASAKTCLRSKVICATLSDLTSPVKVAVISVK